MGNVAGYNGTVLLQLPVAGAVNVGNAAVFYAILDLVVVLVLLFSYFWAKSFVAREAKQVSRLSMTLQDYTVYLPNVDPDTAEEDVRAWVVQVVRKEAGTLSAREECTGALDLYSVCADINRAQAANSDSAARGLVVPSKDIGQMADAAFRVALVSIARSHEVLESSLPLMGSLKAKELSLEGSIKAGLLREHTLQAVRAAEGAPLLGKLSARLTLALAPSQAAQALELARVRVERQEKGLGLDALALSGILGKVPRDLFPAAGAFVSFEHEAARDAFLALARWRSGWLPGWLQRWWYPHFQLKGRHTVVEAPPSPAQLMYFNLRFSEGQRQHKRLLSNALAFVVIVVSFLIILGISLTGQGFQRLMVPTDCSTRTLTTFVKAYNTRKNEEDEKQFLKSYPNSNPLMYCVCDSKAWASMDSREVAANNYTSKCTYQSCPRMSKLAMPRFADTPECAQLSRYAAQVAVFQIIQSLCIMLINDFVSWSIRTLANSEGHHTQVDLEVSVTFRVFVTKVFNTLILTVLINMNLPISLPTGMYSDFTPGWYAGVGASFVQQMFMAALIPHIPKAIALLLSSRNWHNSALYLSNLYQAPLVQTLQGPVMDFSTRASEVFTVFYVTVVFMANMPLMTIAGLTALASGYWADKLFLVRLHRRPPFADSALIESLVEYIPLAIVAHLGVAIWTLSAMQLLAGLNALINPFGTAAGLPPAGGGGNFSTTAPSPPPRCGPCTCLGPPQCSPPVRPP